MSRMVRPLAKAMRYALGCLGLVCLLAPLPGQAAPADEVLPPPRGVPESRPANGPASEAARSLVQAACDEAVAAGVGPAMPISLPNALRLAVTSNLDIAQAREVVAVADAAYFKTNVVVLPDFNLGSALNLHQGNIQKTEGNIEKVNRDSLFVGGGPSFSVQIADAIFFRLAARQVLAATSAGLQRVNNETLLAVAEAYFAVLRNRRRLARVDETLDYLLSRQPAANRSGSSGLYPLIQSVVESGGAEAARSELERVKVEVLGRQEERVGILQDYRVASAELARLLRLDPAIPLWPVEDFRRPLGMPGEAWLSRPVEELASVALQNRPDIAENQALVRAALARVDNARYRPWLPNLVMNYNWGDFGGGPDQNIAVTTTGGKTTATAIGGLPGQPGSYGPAAIRHFGTRTEMDVSMVWKLNNLGFGNLADLRAAQAQYRQVQFRRLQIQDLVVAQVVQAYQLVLGWRHRVDVSGASLFDSRGRADGPVFQSLRLSFEKVRAVPGTRTLEVLDSIRGLNSLLDAYANAVTDYERARFRLIFALGMPAQGLWDGHSMPQPPGKGNQNNPQEGSPQ